MKNFDAMTAEFISARLYELSRQINVLETEQKDLLKHVYDTPSLMHEILEIRRNT